MAIVKLTLNDEHYQKLLKMADNENKSPQQYIYDLVFQESTIFTPAEAVKRAHQKFANGEPFTVPDLYSEEEWRTIGRGPAGVLGKRFFHYISNNKEANIIFVDMGKYGRRAVYRVKGGYNNEQ